MPSEEIPGDLLIFIVGKSGSGKDTLMRESMRLLKEKKIPVSIMQRFITRISDKNEESIFITKEKFLKRNQMNEFALSWFIFGNWYGISRKSIETLIKRGEIVLVNVSRSILHKARESYPRCKIVLIDVPVSITKERIRSRGRDNGKGYEARLARMQRTDIDMPPPNKIIINDKNLERAVSELSSYIEHLYNTK
jgi:phosphonate metabolism protein PhnN/1,5-bisphosphokinase (PRPP-forming)